MGSLYSEERENESLSDESEPGEASRKRNEIYRRWHTILSFLQNIVRHKGNSPQVQNTMQKAWKVSGKPFGLFSPRGPLHFYYFTLIRWKLVQNCDLNIYTPSQLFHVLKPQYHFSLASSTS